MDATWKLRVVEISRNKMKNNIHQHKKILPDHKTVALVSSTQFSPATSLHVILRLILIISLVLLRTRTSMGVMSCAKTEPLGLESLDSCERLFLTSLKPNVNGSGSSTSIADVLSADCMASLVFNSPELFRPDCHRTFILDIRLLIEAFSSALALFSEKLEFLLPAASSGLKSFMKKEPSRIGNLKCSSGINTLAEKSLSILVFG